MDGERKDRFVAFMAHIALKDWNDVIQIIERKFSKRKYLVVGEKKPYEHMHFCIDMSDKEYRNFANQVFRQKYNLRGRASNGKSRQYGKIKEIRDLELLLAYMLKDGIEYHKNVWTTMDKNMLEKLYEEKSRVKEEKPHLMFIKYLRNSDNIGETRSFGQRQMKVVLLRQLATIWLALTNSRLPMSRTLWYYAYKADKISLENYIKITYSEFELDNYSPLKPY